MSRFCANRGRRRLAIVAGGGVLLLAVAAIAVYLTLLADLPEPSALRLAERPESVKIFDRDGRLLYEWLGPLEGKYTWVPLSDVPLALQQATIATEDASFYTNPGFDLRAILRAAYQDLRGGQIVSGASTITQQVARMLLLSPDERSQRTWRRKIREAFLAWRITRSYSKDEILELYLNHSYYGNLAYGIEAAAEAYFDKRVSELDLAECALLAGLPQSPVGYNPLTNPDAAAERQAIVLRLMVETGYLSEEGATIAGEEPLRFASAPVSIEAPHFTLYAMELAAQALGEEAWAQGGWRIYTTLDLDLQRQAEAIIQRHLADLNDPKRTEITHNINNAGLVALDPTSGEILAMVGSPDYFDGAIAGAVNAALAPRQPGSSIKPITYAAALSRGYTPATVINDVRKVFITAEGDPFVPTNYDKVYHGPISAREALATSSNMAAVRVLNDIGVPTLLNTARDMGITWFGDPTRFGLALTLGGGEVRLLDLTAAYACFAAQGKRVSPMAIGRIEDAEGRVVYRSGPPLEEVVVDPRIAYLVTDILSDDKARIPAFGEQSALYLGRPAAAKTGTTTDWRDNWALGYTPDLVAGVWVGNADNQPMTEVSGITGAAPIWQAFMRAALKGKPETPFTEPDGIIQVAICPESGLLPGPYCPNVRYEKFVAGTEPTKLCDVHQAYRIDAATGLLATADTPPERVAQRIYWILPPEAQEWGREQGIPAPPQAQPSSGSVQSGPALQITSPDPNTRFVLSKQLPAQAQSIQITALWGAHGQPSQVALFVDGQALAALEQGPYSVRWTLQVGAHTAWAEALDSAGKTWTSPRISFSVEPPQ